MFGVPVPLVLPVAVPAELLARCSFDINVYRQLGVDHCWSLLDYQDIRDRQALTVRQTMEMLSRTARAAVAMVSEPERHILVMPAETASGKALSLSEIEKATELVRQCGRTWDRLHRRSGDLAAAADKEAAPAGSDAQRDVRGLRRTERSEKEREGMPLEEGRMARQGRMRPLHLGEQA